MTAVKIIFQVIIYLRTWKLIDTIYDAGKCKRLIWQMVSIKKRPFQFSQIYLVS